MESKLLVGGKTIIDHTNEQQKMLEQKRQEISEQVLHGLLSRYSTGTLDCGFTELFCDFADLFKSGLQIRREREIQQQMMLQDEETLEMRETFSTMQQEVELKTKKLRRVR